MWFNLFKRSPELQLILEQIKTAKVLGKPSNTYSGFRPNRYKVKTSNGLIYETYYCDYGWHVGYRYKSSVFLKIHLKPKEVRILSKAIIKRVEEINTYYKNEQRKAQITRFNSLIHQ